MSDNSLPQEILIITGSTSSADSDLDFRDSSLVTKLTGLTTPVSINNLQGQVNIFLQQLNQVLSNTPTEVSGFKLNEIEVSAGIVVKGQGEVKIALLGSAEVGGELNAALKFLFKRSS